MPRILVVEDSHAQAVALRQLLQAAGYEVEVAMDGTAGLERARRGAFDLVLSDVLMPGMDGYELCRALKGDPQTRQTPVILLTSLRDPADILQGLACGAANFIQKPYDDRYVLNRIASIFEQRPPPEDGAGDPVRIAFGGRQFDIRAGKQRMLEYLLSTYEDFMRAKEREQHSRVAEVGLRESLNLLQSTLDALSAQIAILDQNGAIITVNAAWRHGGTGNPLVPFRHGGGANYLALCDALAQEGLEQAGLLADGIRAVIGQRRDSLQLEYSVRHGEQEGWFVARVTRFSGAGPVRVVVAHESTTEQKRAEAALRESQRRLTTLMSNLPGMAYRCQTDPGWSMRFASEGSSDLIGYSPADLVGSRRVSFHSLIHADDRERVDYVRRAALRAGIPFRLVYRIATAAGQERWVWEHGRGVVAPNGQTVAVEGIISDITARKAAEEAMAEEAQISAALARVGREMIALSKESILLDRLSELSAEILACDFCQIWLLDRDENAYAAVSDYGTPAELWQAQQILRIPEPTLAVLREQLARDDVLQQVASVSERSPLTRILEGSGATVGLYVALRRGEDMTGFLLAGYRGRPEAFSPVQQRVARGLAHLGSLALETARLVEQLERANRFKSDFLAAMSHELRTPLNVVIGYDSLLLEEAFGTLNEEQADTVRRIDKNARELLELVSATLSLTRFDARDAAPSFEEVDIAALMDEVRRETEALVKKPEVTVGWQIDGELPPLQTDPLKLRMALKNLIGNAIKFTDHGSIDVSAMRLDGGVEFAVRDTGIGIPPSAQALVFEPFQQAHGSTSQRRGGAGLGLYLVRRIVDLLGGQIRLTSQVGVGSTFRIWLPSGERSSRES